MENQALFNWFPYGDPLEDPATHLSHPSFSLPLCGGHAYQNPSIYPPIILPLAEAPPQDLHLPPGQVSAMDDDFNFNFDSFILEEAALLDFNVETPPAAPAPSHHHHHHHHHHHQRHHSAALRHPGEGESEEEEGSSALKKAAPARPRTSSIAFEDVSKFFYMPITEAAKAMRVGLTVLKKRCRELGISRWPHRKMKSLNSLIHNVQELGKGVAMEDSIRREIETLEEHKRLLEMMPEMQLTERTKKLRQACFKANFKKRRASQIPSPRSLSV